MGLCLNVLCLFQKRCACDVMYRRVFWYWESATLYFPLLYSTLCNTVYNICWVFSVECTIYVECWVCSICWVLRKTKLNSQAPPVTPDTLTRRTSAAKKIKSIIRNHCSKCVPSVLIYQIVISMIRDTQRPLWSSRAPVVPWKLVPAGTVVSWERCRHNFSKVSEAQNCWHNSIFCRLVESYPHKMDSVTLVCLSLLCLWRKTEQRKENEDTNDV